MAQSALQRAEDPRDQDVILSGKRSKSSFQGCLVARKLRRIFGSTFSAAQGFAVYAYRCRLTQVSVEAP